MKLFLQRKSGSRGMSDRNKAPRRSVLSVSHVSGYGTTWWKHRLECGHVEERKRKAVSSRIGCSACIAAERGLARQLVELMSLPDEGQTFADDVVVEFEASRVAAEIASRLKISVEMVDVQITSTGGGLKISGVRVWVPGDVALSLVAAK